MRGQSQPERAIGADSPCLFPAGPALPPAPDTLLSPLSPTPHPDAGRPSQPVIPEPSKKFRVTSPAKLRPRRSS